jgi:hypothetical protein
MTILMYVAAAIFGLILGGITGANKGFPIRNYNRLILGSMLLFSIDLLEYFSEIQTVALPQNLDFWLHIGATWTLCAGLSGVIFSAGD